MTTRHIPLASGFPPMYSASFAGGAGDGCDIHGLPRAEVAVIALTVVCYIGYAAALNHQLVLLLKPLLTYRL